MSTSAIAEWFSAGLFFMVWGWGMARIFAAYKRFTN